MGIRITQLCEKGTVFHTEPKQQVLLPYLIYKAVGLYVVCLSVCLSASISQVKLSLPGTFDLLLSVWLWGLHRQGLHRQGLHRQELHRQGLHRQGLHRQGLHNRNYIGRDYIGRDYRGGGLQRRGPHRHGVHRGTPEAGEYRGRRLQRQGLKRRGLQRYGTTEAGTKEVGTADSVAGRQWLYSWGPHWNYQRHGSDLLVHIY